MLYNVYSLLCNQNGFTVFNFGASNFLRLALNCGFFIAEVSFS